MAGRPKGQRSSGKGADEPRLICPKAVCDSTRAKGIWGETIASVPPGKGGPVYSRMLGQYCLALARAEEASEHLGSSAPDKTKLIVSGGKRGGAKRSPFLDIAKEQNEIARKLAAELGLLGGGARLDQANPPMTNGVVRAGAPEGAPPAVGGPPPHAGRSHGGQNPVYTSVYTSPALETFESRADFARRHGVSRAAVGKWASQGYIVFQGDRIDVWATDAKLRDAGMGRFRKSDDVLTEGGGLQPGLQHGLHGGLQPGGSEPGENADNEGAAPLDIAAATEFLQGLLNGKLSSIAAAAQVKENALAGIRLLEFLKADGKLIELEVARDVLFEQARSFRDALMKWPADIGPRLAAELNHSAEAVTGALTRYVHTLLSDLGEPDPEFSTDEQG